jgi:hypothetical protein
VLVSGAVVHCWAALPALQVLMSIFEPAADPCSTPETRPLGVTWDDEWPCWFA